MSTNNYFRGYEVVIGIEVHVQLKTESKIFCADATNFEAADNENISPISIGMPGTLPALNEKAILYAIRTGLALGCKIRKKSVFSRKNYFYPDLPKGYQISQYDEPICEGGEIKIKVNDELKKIKITRAHLEEDAGKSTHFGDYTLLNYNRAGIPLLEIVSEPDMRSALEAAEYARAIRQVVRYIQVCDGNLEEGSLRCDCNVSIRKAGDTKLGTKVELKNLNSFRFIEKAIEYEIDRQIDELENGKKIIQETRLYDADKNRTFTMRTKEDAEDYRYFPDPDLLPIIIEDDIIEKIKSELPELPIEKENRFISTLGVSEDEAKILTAERDLAEYFEQVNKEGGNSKLAASWVLSELLREINNAKLNIKESPISPKNLGQLIKLIDAGTISGKIGKIIFAEMWQTQESPQEIMKKKNISQVTDSAEIEQIVEEILKTNASQVAEYRSGKTKVFGFFVGAAMKATKGQANPDMVNKILKTKLDSK